MEYFYVITIMSEQQARVTASGVITAQPTDTEQTVFWRTLEGAAKMGGFILEKVAVEFYYLRPLMLP